VRLPLHRDKDGRVVYDYPCLLVVDPLADVGRLYADEEAAAADFQEDDLMPGVAPETVTAQLAARGWRLHFLRSDADLVDEVRRHLALSEGELQETLAARWLQQDFSFPGAEHVVWEGTTTRLYTDGERVVCEGHVVTLAPNAPAPEALQARVEDWLDAFATDVAHELKAPLAFVRPRG
jgi:hypothetical protein